jgi:hypothetical protein
MMKEQILRMHSTVVLDAMTYGLWGREKELISEELRALSYLKCVYEFNQIQTQ